MANEGAYVSQTDGECAALKLIYKVFTGSVSTFEFHRYHTPEGIHLALGEFVLWVAEQTGITDPRHRWVRLKERRDASRIFTVSCIAQR